jgi:uncharacterized protein YdeI (YjbR/CyaY-like superfamily)
MSGPQAEEAAPRLFRNAQAWSLWLGKNHDKSDGLWLRIAKKNSGEISVSCPEALEACLCYGWIDGQRKSQDESFFLQRYTPRRARSIWSKINRQKALDLIASGAMQPAGLAEVERAKKDGRWEAAYDSKKSMAVPADLAAALKADPKAASFFEKLDSRNRYAVLLRLHTIKKAETRARRLAEFVAMLGRHETLHPAPVRKTPAKT